MEEGKCAACIRATTLDILGTINEAIRCACSTEEAGALNQIYLMVQVELGKLYKEKGGKGETVDSN